MPRGSANPAGGGAEPASCASMLTAETGGRCAGTGDLPDLAVGLGEDIELAGGIATEPQIHPRVSGQLLHAHLPAGGIEHQQLVYRRQLLATAHLGGVRVEEPSIHV